MSYLENHLGAFHALDRAWQVGNCKKQPRSAQFASVFYATATIGGNQGLQALAPTFAAADVGARLAIQGLTLVLRGRRCATVGGSSEPGSGPMKVKLGIGVRPSFLVRPHLPTLPPKFLRLPRAPRRAFMLGVERWAS